MKERGNKTRNITKTFTKHFSCSETMNTLLNREHSIVLEEVEQAIDPLSGGLLGSLDSACGILWGASLAAGIRAYNKFDEIDVAGAAAVYATKRIVDEYKKENEYPIDCRDILGLKSKKWNFFKFLFKNGMSICYGNMIKWELRFNEIIDYSLNEFDSKMITRKPINCACDCMKKVAEAINLDISNYEHIPAGLSGGIGLHGNGCGALGAAIFTQCLKYYIGRKKKSRDSMFRSHLQGLKIGDSWKNPSRRLHQAFMEKFGTMYCKKITKTSFSTIDDLSEYLSSGGCKEVIDSLASFASE
ncbi:MAG: C-GCAxxG-C-C family (seleno)protein [Candidatus Aminicenantaceae bacterium]